MLQKHGLGKRHANGMLARRPRAIVGVVLGLVLAVAQGQSKADPLYGASVTPMVPFSPRTQTSQFPVSVDFTAASPGSWDIGGRAVAGPRGVGVSSSSHIVNGGFASIFAEASLQVSDMVVTPIPGTDVTPLVPGALKLNFTGYLENLVTYGLVGGCPFGTGLTSMSAVHIDVRVDDSTFSGSAEEHGFSDSTHPLCTGATQLSLSGLLSGWRNGPTPGGPGSALLTVPNLQLPVNRPFRLGLFIWANTSAEGRGPRAIGAAHGFAEFSHTLSFPTVGPVFDLPSGYTVNSVDGLIQDNHFVGGGSSGNPPVANAGPDQTVTEEQLVTLDGSASTAPSGLPLSYSWTQVAGEPPVTLDLSDPVHPTFVAPSVPVAGSTLSFQLVVSDENLSSTPVTVNITVKHVNHPPVASGGPDQAVAEASLVTVDGSASYDPDADPLTFLWSQTAGPQVILSDTHVAQPTFLAPLVGSAGMTLSFQLTVSDGQASADTTTTVHVTNVNHPPVAHAGPDQTRNAGTTVQLDGTASTDPDSDPLAFTWSQLSGPTVTLSNVQSATPTFVSPHVAVSTTLTFQLLVDDGLGGTASADVKITLLPVDAPPVCMHAKAHPQFLWPPDHKLADVKIVGVTDPDSRKVKLTVTHVTQDEPVGCRARRGSRDYDEGDDETRGCRHTTPDAIIHRDGHVALRAERREHDNGRVYHITFQADDGAGGQCTGRVTVCVPHDRRHPTCVDDGQRYDATQR
jgi:hypothetical protein